jgi:SAM-dependent methyltransferase
MQGSETGAELPSGSCDAIFMRGVYHHFTAPQQMNGSLFRALRPGGTLAVIDFPPRLLLWLCTPKGIPATPFGGLRTGAGGDGGVAHAACRLRSNAGRPRQIEEPAFLTFLTLFQIFESSDFPVSLGKLRNRRFCPVFSLAFGRHYFLHCC